MTPKLKLANLARTFKNIKLDDLNFSSISYYLTNLNFSSDNIKPIVISFISSGRNRLILSCGFASLFLLSILPSKVELILAKRSQLNEYKLESSLLNDLQDELERVNTEISGKALLQSRISDLIPDESQAEKVLPILLTNLLNLFDLSLIEIVAVDENTYLSGGEDSLSNLADLNSLDEDQEFLSDDDEFQDGFDDDSEFDYSDEFEGDLDSDFIDESDDTIFSLEDEDSFNGETLVSNEPSITSLYYSISTKGSPLNLFEFFSRLHSTRILSSVGRVSYQQDSSSTSSNTPNTVMSPSNAELTMSFTLRVAVNSTTLLTENPSPLSDDFSSSLDPLEDLPLPGDDLSSDYDALPPLDDVD